MIQKHDLKSVRPEGSPPAPDLDSNIMPTAKIVAEYDCRIVRIDEKKRLAFCEFERVHGNGSVERLSGRVSFQDLESNGIDPHSQRFTSGVEEIEPGKPRVFLRPWRVREVSREELEALRRGVEEAFGDGW